MVISISIAVERQVKIMKHWADQEASPRQMGMDFVASPQACSFVLHARQSPSFVHECS